MSTELVRSPETPPVQAPPGGLDSSPAPAGPLTLGALPIGARLVLRCRKDWRAATVSGFEPGAVRLNVNSPSGHTYRVRRPHDTPLIFEGSIPILGEVPPAGWRPALARYDARW